MTTPTSENIEVLRLSDNSYAVELNKEKTILIFDYFGERSHALDRMLDKNPFYDVVIFVSQHNSAHYRRSVFELMQNRRKIYIVSNDVPAKEIPSTLNVQGMSAGDSIDLPDSKINVKAYGTSGKGVSFMVTLYDNNNYRIFFGGDLNIWHSKTDLTERGIDEVANKYHHVINRIASEIDQINVAFLAVDPRQGDDFAKSVDEFLENIKVDEFFPAHYAEDEKKEVCSFDYLPKGCNTKAHCLELGQTMEL